MLDVRNSDGRLVCRVDKRTGAVEICIKGCITVVERQPDGEIRISNNKRTA